MDLSLIETLRWEPEAGFVRLERHLTRLARSAAALELPGSEGAREALFAALPSLPFSPTGRRWPKGPDEGACTILTVSAPPSSRCRDLLPVGEKEQEAPSPSITRRAEGGEQHPTPLRVRLELFPDGRIDVQTAAFTLLAPDATWRLKIAETRLASADPLLRHKTSHRSVYATARAEFPASEADEVLLLNERGDLCEGTITTLFLDDGSGILKTPPLTAGLLAGVLRAELLESGKAVEAVLRPDDLSEGEIFVGNSLRGLIRAQLSQSKMPGINAG